MNKKNRNILLITIIGILILGIGCYAILTMVSNKDESSNTEKMEYTISKLNFNDCNYTKNSTCTKKADDIEISVIKEEDYYHIKINNKEVLSDVYFVDEFDILDNNIIFATSDTDIRSTELYAFDKNGNQIFKFRDNIDEKYPTSMVIDWENPYEIKDESIIFGGSRLFHGPLIVTENESVSENFIDISSCQNAEKYGDEIIQGQYRIDYLGNGKFSSVINESRTKLRDSKTFDTICN